jgi:hypothetical protein
MNDVVIDWVLSLECFIMQCLLTRVVSAACQGRMGQAWDQYGTTTEASEVLQPTKIGNKESHGQPQAKGKGGLKRRIYSQRGNLKVGDYSQRHVSRNSIPDRRYLLPSMVIG